MENMDLGIYKTEILEIAKDIDNITEKEIEAIEQYISEVEIIKYVDAEEILLEYTIEEILNVLKEYVTELQDLNTLSLATILVQQKLYEFLYELVD